MVFVDYVGNEAMVIRVCGAIRGTVGGVTRSFSTSTIRGASGPIRYNPQVPGSAKPVRRETSEDSAAAAAGVSHSRPLLPKWKQRAPQTDQDWSLRKKEEQKRYWDEQGDGTGSDASAELQRLKTEMKLRDSSSTQSSQAPPPSSSQKNLPVHVEEEEENQADQPVLAIADLEERPAVARHPAFDNAGLFYGDGRKFEGLNSSSSSSSKKKKNSNPPNTTPLQGSELFYGDGRKFATDPFESSVEATLFEAADKTLATEKQAAKTYALRLLGMAPQTAHKLKQKLLGRSVSAPVIESTIADLQRSGLQSDLEYAEAFARSRWRSALWGPQRLKQELKRRGVCSEDVATALEKVFTSSTDDESRDEENEADDDEREAAVWGMTREAREHLVAKARQQWALRGGGSVVSAEARKRRMIGWLQRRGFNWSITSRILKLLLESDKNPLS